MTTREPHPCQFCGTYVDDDGYETIHEQIIIRDYSGDRGIPASKLIPPGTYWLHRPVRHWLSDCRPDLVQHDIGPLCTWYGACNHAERDCYAYQNRDTREWTDQHIYFYPDGPM